MKIRPSALQAEDGWGNDLAFMVMDWHPIEVLHVAAQSAGDVDWHALPLEAISGTAVVLDVAHSL